MEKEGDGDSEEIKVEGKIFSCYCAKEGIVLKEGYRNGDRQIFLSREQARWMEEGLRNRFNQFGLTPRRESMDGDMMVSIFEGSNRNGCFLSLQTRLRKETHYVIVPAGKYGRHWGDVSSLLRRILAKQSVYFPIGSSPENSTNISSAFSRSTLQGRSFADILKGTSFQHRLESQIVLEERLALLESEIAILRDFVSAQNPNLFGKMNNNRDMHRNPTAVTYLNSMARSPCDPSKGSGRLFSPNAECELLFNNLCPLDPATDFVQLTQLELSGSTGKPNFCSLTLSLSSSEPNNNFCSNSNMSPSKEVNIDCTTDSIGPLETSLTEEDSSQADADAISWDDFEETFVHDDSGMRFHPGLDVFFSWVTPNIDDLRRLYYEPVNGSLTLARHGKWGNSNNNLLMEHDWDRNTIYSEKTPGFRHDLFGLFMMKLDESDSSSFSP